MLRIFLFAVAAQNNFITKSQKKRNEINYENMSMCAC